MLQCGRSAKSNTWGCFAAKSSGSLPVSRSARSVMTRSMPAVVGAGMVMYQDSRVPLADTWFACAGGICKDHVYLWQRAETARTRSPQR